MTDYIDKLYASGATDEDVEEFVKKQSGTKPEDFEPLEEPITNISQESE